MDSRMMFWSRWLGVASGLVLLMGLAFVFAASPVQALFESAYYTPNTGAELTGDAAAYTAFLQGVLGAVMAGWAVIIIWVALVPFARREPFSWEIIALSIGLWYVVDTLFSLITGYWQNAILNTGMLVMFAIPLAATRHEFPQGTSHSRDLAFLQRLEEELLRPEVRASRSRLDNLLSAEFYEHGSSGRRWFRSDVLQAAQEGNLPRIEQPITSFQATMLRSPSALATYRSVTTEDSGAKHRVLRSSIWTYTQGEWQLLFHQGTPIPDSPTEAQAHESSEHPSNDN